MNDMRDEAWERRLDAGLAENEGGTVPPDVTAAVLARMAHGEADGDLHGTTAEPMPRRTGGWLAAAMMLLGCGVVAGMWAMRMKAPELVELPAQGPRTAPDWRRVTSRAELDALPQDVKFVATYNLGDDDLEALTSRTLIEGLRLGAGTSMTDKPRRLLTAPGLRHLARFAKLRVLELDWQLALQDQPLDALADLPLVEELALSRFDTTDEALAVLERMPSLRSLDLTLNHGFRGEGVRCIARLPGLRSLRLTSCSQLSVPMLAPLSSVRLRTLDLGHIGRGFRGMFVDGDQTDESQRRAAMQDRAKREDAGLTAAVVDVLPRFTLRLSIAETDLGDDAVAAIVARLPHLQELDLSGCPGLTTASIDAVAASGTLRSVDLQRLPWATIALAKRLANTGKEVAISFDQSTQAYPKVPDRRHLLSITPTPDQDREAPKFVVVRSRAEIEALDPATIAVDGLGLDAAAVKSLRRCKNLERLRLRYGAQTSGDGAYLSPATNQDNSKSIDDDGLHDLVELRTLTHLELQGTVNVRGPGIVALENLQNLQSLRLACFDVSDATLTALPKFRSLRSLQIEFVHGFAAQALREIARCPKLVDLTIAHGSQLRPDDIAELGAATGLQRLALRDLGKIRDDSQRSVREDERANVKPYARLQPALTDRSLMALQNLTELRQLELTFGAFTSMGLQTLAAMQHLELLDLTGNRELVPSAIVHVPASVTTLRLGLCTGLDDPVGPAIRDRLPALRELSLASVERLTPTGLAPLLELPALNKLDVRRCPQLGTSGGTLLLAAKQVTNLVVISCGLSDDQLAQLRAEGRQVLSTVW